MEDQRIKAVLDAMCTTAIASKPPLDIKLLAVAAVVAIDAYNAGFDAGYGTGVNNECPICGQKHESTEPTDDAVKTFLDKLFGDMDGGS